MPLADLRVALFSGNYDYVRDGANQALNRLVDYLLRNGAQVRIYAPKVARPAFTSKGEVIGVPSIPIPGRSEYRLPLALTRRVRADLEAFAPNVVHLSSPDIVAHRALAWAHEQGLPTVASVHTRFETYFRFYGLGFLEPLIRRMLRRFYNRCDCVLAPSSAMARIMRLQGLNRDVVVWERGVDHAIFNPARRDLSWRRSLGIVDDEVVIGYLGRLVMEKSLDVYAAAIEALRERGIAHRVLVVGEGPAREWFEQAMPGAVFLGHLDGNALPRAVASMDVLFCPSVTEAFGNVILEAMACAVPSVAARAPASAMLIEDGISGTLVDGQDPEAFADALSRYATAPQLRQAHGLQGEEASRGFDWDEINRVVPETYLRLILERAGMSAASAERPQRSCAEHTMPGEAPGQRSPRA